MNLISKDILNIIKTYLLISKYNVKRNYNLLVYEYNNIHEIIKVCNIHGNIFIKNMLDYIQYYNKSKIFHYCPFCDNPTSFYSEYRVSDKLLYQRLKYATTKYSCIKCDVIQTLKSYILNELQYKINNCNLLFNYNIKYKL